MSQFISLISLKSALYRKASGPCPSILSSDAPKSRNTVAWTYWGEYVS